MGRRLIMEVGEMSTPKQRATKLQELAGLQIDQALAATIYRMAEKQHCALHLPGREVAQLGLADNNARASNPCSFTAEDLPDHIRNFCERFFKG